MISGFDFVIEAYKLFKLSNRWFCLAPSGVESELHILSPPRLCENGMVWD